MSWWRSQRRTLDIVTEVGEFDNNNRNNVHSLSTGVYSVQPENEHVIQSAGDSNEHGCVTTPNNDFHDENEKDINVNDDADDVFHDGENNENNLAKSESVSEKVEIDITDMNILTENVGSVVSSDDIVLEPLCGNDAGNQITSCGIDDGNQITNTAESTNELGDEESTNELGDEEAIQEAFKKDGCHKPRYSLDSQVTGLLKSPNACRMHRSSETAISENENENGTIVPKQRKSISWAEDLEAVHEFEKIKSKRLSLGNLFKKM